MFIHEKLKLSLAIQLRLQILELNLKEAFPTQKTFAHWNINPHLSLRLEYTFIVINLSVCPFLYTLEPLRRGMIYTMQSIKPAVRGQEHQFINY